MMQIPLLLALAVSQLLPTRCFMPAQPDDGLGGFSMQLGEGWRPKLPGPPIGKNELSIREPAFLGPRNARMSILRMLKPDPDLLRALPQELDAARARNPESFHDLNRKGYIGGFYAMPIKKHSKGLWIVGKTTSGKDMFSLSLEADSPFKESEMNALVAMLSTLRPEDMP